MARSHLGHMGIGLDVTWRVSARECLAEAPPGTIKQGYPNRRASGSVKLQPNFYSLNTGGRCINDRRRPGKFARAFFPNTHLPTLRTLRKMDCVQFCTDSLRKKRKAVLAAISSISDNDQSH